MMHTRLWAAIAALVGMIGTIIFMIVPAYADNSGPTAVADSYTVQAGASSLVLDPAPMSNDVNAVRIVSWQAQQTVSGVDIHLGPDGQTVYANVDSSVPAQTVSYSYKVADSNGTQSAPVTDTVMITAASQPPPSSSPTPTPTTTPTPTPTSTSNPTTTAPTTTPSSVPAKLIKSKILRHYNPAKRQAAMVRFTNPLPDQALTIKLFAYELNKPLGRIKLAPGRSVVKTFKTVLLYALPVLNHKHYPQKEIRLIAH